MHAFEYINSTTEINAADITVITKPTLCSECSQLNSISLSANITTLFVYVSIKSCRFTTCANVKKKNQKVIYKQIIV